MNEVLRKKAVHVHGYVVEGQVSYHKEAKYVIDILVLTTTVLGNVTELQKQTHKEKIKEKLLPTEKFGKKSEKKKEGLSNQSSCLGVSVLPLTALQSFLVKEDNIKGDQNSL